MDTDRLLTPFLVYYDGITCYTYYFLGESQQCASLYAITLYCKSSAHTYYIIYSSLHALFSACSQKHFLLFYYLLLLLPLLRLQIYNFYYSSKNLLLQLLHDGCLPTNTIYCPATTIREPFSQHSEYSRILVSFSVFDSRETAYIQPFSLFNHRPHFQKKVLSDYLYFFLLLPFKNEI